MESTPPANESKSTKAEDRPAYLVRRNRIILATVAFVILALVLMRTWGILYPFIIGFVIAYLALPLVERLEGWMPRALKKNKSARSLAILIVYLLILVILALSFFLLYSVIFEQVQRLIKEIPVLSQNISNQLNAWSQDNRLAEYWSTYQQNIAADIRLQIENQLQSVSQRIVEGFVSVFQLGLSGVINTVSKTLNFLLGILIIPIWLFYVLSDTKSLSHMISNLVPQSIRSDMSAILKIVDTVFDAFLRGQLILCLVVGLTSFISLAVIGVPYAAVLGLIAAITEAIPMIGPLLGMIPALIIAIAVSPNALLLTFIAYMIISQIESVVLKPRVMGDSLSLHPAIVMVVLFIGADIGGILGMILAAPLTAVVRDLFKYFYLRLSARPVSPESALERIKREEMNLDEI